MSGRGQEAPCPHCGEAVQIPGRIELIAAQPGQKKKFPPVLILALCGTGLFILILAGILLAVVFSRAQKSTPDRETAKAAPVRIEPARKKPALTFNESAWKNPPAGIETVTDSTAGNMMYVCKEVTNAPMQLDTSYFYFYAYFLKTPQGEKKHVLVLNSNAGPCSQINVKFASGKERRYELLSSGVKNGAYDQCLVQIPSKEYFENFVMDTPVSIGVQLPAVRNGAPVEMQLPENQADAFRRMAAFFDVPPPVASPEQQEVRALVLTFDKLARRYPRYQTDSDDFLDGLLPMLNQSEKLYPQVRGKELLSRDEYNFVACLSVMLTNIRISLRQHKLSEMFRSKGNAEEARKAQLEAEKVFQSNGELYQSAIDYAKKIVPGYSAK